MSNCSPYLSLWESYKPGPCPPELVIQQQKPLLVLWYPQNGNYCNLPPFHHATEVTFICDGHMSEEDRYVINGSRKAVNVGVVEELELDGIHVIEWFKVMGERAKVGWSSEEKWGVWDGVHQTKSSNSFTAVSLLFRVSEMELQGMERVRGGGAGAGEIKWDKKMNTVILPKRAAYRYFRGKKRICKHISRLSKNK